MKLLKSRNFVQAIIINNKFVFEYFKVYANWMINCKLRAINVIFIWQLQSVFYKSNFFECALIA